MHVYSGSVTTGRRHRQAVAAGPQEGATARRQRRATDHRATSLALTGEPRAAIRPAIARSPTGSGSAHLIRTSPKPQAVKSAAE